MTAKAKAEAHRRDSRFADVVIPESGGAPPNCTVSVG